MLELSVYPSLFMVKGKCIPRFKKEEERRESGPVRNPGNGNCRGLVTLEPFQLPDWNDFPDAVSTVVSWFGWARPLLCAWTMPRRRVWWLMGRGWLGLAGGGSAPSPQVRSLRSALLTSAPEGFTSAPGIFPLCFCLNPLRQAIKLG